jgi:hypothetical protein
LWIPRELRVRKQNLPRISDFEWETNRYYAWISTMPVDGEPSKASPSWYLCDDVPAPLPAGDEAMDGVKGDESDDNSRLTKPLRDTGLFLKFSSLEPTPDAIVKFAEVHGFLGRPIITKVVVPGPDGNATSNGEALEAWRREIRSLRAAVDLWHAIQERDVDRIGGLLQEVYKIYSGVVSNDYLMNRTWRQILDRSRTPDIILKLPHDRQLTAALDFVQLAIKHKLKGQVSADVRLSDEGGAIGFMPETLLGAMWLQFAHAVAYKKEFRDCEFCGAPFEVSLEAARTSRMYCSTRCKIQAYRKRRAEAKALRAAGIPPAEIAKRLNSDLETVRGWLGEATHPGAKRRPVNAT